MRAHSGGRTVRSLLPVRRHREHQLADRRARTRVLHQPVAVGKAAVVLDAHQPVAGVQSSWHATLAAPDRTPVGYTGANL